MDSEEVMLHLTDLLKFGSPDIQQKVFSVGNIIPTPAAAC
jgi:hypothetical protein